MSKILAGFARVNINPMRGIGVAGYYKVRRAEGILDDLEAVALALSDGEKKAVFISVDLCQVQTPICDRLRRAVAEATGLDASAVYLHSTHTHTAPYVDVERAKAGGLDTEEDLRLVAEYQDLIYIVYQFVLILCVSKLLGVIDVFIQDHFTWELLLKTSKFIAKILIPPITMTLNFFVMRGVVEKL